MSSYLPPVFRGKIATTSGRLLAAAAAMFVLNIPLFGLTWGRSEIPFFLWLNFWQMVALIAVLLFSPRRWVALLLMLPACFFFLPMTPADSSWERACDCGTAIAPLLLGIFIAYPRPRKRWVYVEEDEEPADEGATQGQGR